MEEDIRLLRKFLIQIFGASIAIVILLTLVIGLSLLINSFIVGIILYFIDLVTDSTIFSIGNILFGASLLTVIEVILHKNRDNK